MRAEHPSVSRCHAALVGDVSLAAAGGNGRLLLVDLGSTHGTRVDGARALPHEARGPASHDASHSGLSRV